MTMAVSNALAAGDALDSSVHVESTGYSQIKLGDQQVTAMYLGNNQVTAVYLGDNQII